MIRRRDRLFEELAKGAQGIFKYTHEFRLGESGIQRFEIGLHYWDGVKDRIMSILKASPAHDVF